MKLFSIKEKQNLYQIYYAFYMFGKPIGLSCYTIFVEKINLKNIGKTKIFVTPLDFILLIFSIMFNCTLSLYYINETMIMAHTKDHDRSRSIFNYGLMLTLIMSHTLSGLSIFVVFINRKLNWDIVRTMNYVDQKLNDLGQKIEYTPVYIQALFVLIGSNIFLMFIYIAFSMADGMSKKLIIYIVTCVTTNYTYIIISTRFIITLRILYEKFEALNDIIKSVHGRMSFLYLQIIC